MKKCAFHWLLPFWFCITAFDAIKRLALGADHINMARPMMFALGCIQARKCNSNRCPDEQPLFGGRIGSGCQGSARPQFSSRDARGHRRHTRSNGAGSQGTIEALADRAKGQSFGVKELFEDL
ncbi:MAG: hypothetical protein H7318_16745 [Oligoflexus sp.]|nr:hypothetical protein [Oligoflexus sp.]